MDALSSEWKRSVQYHQGDRVAFKLGDAMGVAAFECLLSRKSYPPVPFLLVLTLLSDISTLSNQPVAGGTVYWKHYPKGFPRKS